jgi:hypothetical protein
VRTRFIDDLVLDAVADGVTRVVLLGAGYDSRAYWLPARRTRAHSPSHRMKVCTVANWRQWRCAGSSPKR